MRFGRCPFYTAVFFILLSFNFSRNVFAWPFGNKDQGAQKSKTQSSEALPAIPQLPQTPKIPSAKIAVPVLPVPPTPTLHQDPDIAKVQKQIQEIIKINESLKANYAGQAAEIQKISEQARIHQRILKDLEAAKNRPPVAKINPENFMNREKVRLIEKETDKNNQFLNRLKNQDLSKKNPSVPQEAKAQQT